MANQYIKLGGVTFNLEGLKDYSKKDFEKLYASLKNRPSLPCEECWKQIETGLKGYNSEVEAKVAKVTKSKPKKAKAKEEPKEQEEKPKKGTWSNPLMKFEDEPKDEDQSKDA